MNIGSIHKSCFQWITTFLKSLDCHVDSDSYIPFPPPRTRCQRSGKAHSWVRYPCFLTSLQKVVSFLLYSLREAMVCALFSLCRIASYRAMITSYSWSLLRISSLSLWDSPQRMVSWRRGESTDMPLMNQHKSLSRYKAGPKAGDSVNARSMDAPAFQDVPFALKRLSIPRSIKVLSASFVFEQWERSGCSSEFNRQSLCSNFRRSTQAPISHLGHQSTREPVSIQEPFDCSPPTLQSIFGKKNICLHQGIDFDDCAPLSHAWLTVKYYIYIHTPFWHQLEVGPRGSIRGCWQGGKLSKE